MITNLRIDRLDGRGPIPLPGGDLDQVLYCFSERAVIYGNTNNLDGSVVNLDCTSTVLGSAGVEYKVVETLNSQSEESKTFRIFIGIDPLSTREITIGDEDQDIVLTLVYSDREEILGGATLSIEDKELILQIKKDEIISHCLVRTTIHYQGFFEETKTSVVVSDNITKSIVTQVKDNFLFVDATITLWIENGNRKSSRVRLYNSPLSDLRNYREPLEFTKYTQYAINALPEWSDCRTKDTEFLNRMRAITADTYPKDYIDENIQDESTLQKLVNASAGMTLQDIELDLKRTTNKLSVERFPLDEISLLHRIPVQTEQRTGSLSRDSFRLFIDQVQSTDLNSFFGKSILWEYPSVGVPEFRGSFVISSTEVFTVYLNTISGSWIKIEVSDKILIQSSSGIESRYDNPFGSYTDKFILTIDYSAGIITLFMDSISFGPVIIKSNEQDTLMKNIQISTSGSNSRTLNLESFEGFTGSFSSLILEDGTACIPVTNIEDLRLAPTTEIVELPENDRPRAPRVRWDTFSLYHDHQVLDKNSRSWALYLTQYADRLRVISDPNKDINSDCPILIDGTSLFFNILDLCYQNDRCYVLTKKYIIEVDPRTPNPSTPVTYVMGISKFINPHPEATKIFIDGEGRIWLS